MKTIRAMIMATVAVALTAMAADEITAVYQLNVFKGYLSVNKGTDFKATLQGNAYDQRVSSFNTNEANLLPVSSGITTGGVSFFRNLSTNCNAVVTASFELYPGEALMGRLLLTNVVVYSKTNGVPGTWGITTNVVGVTTNSITNWPAATVNIESLLLAQ